MMSGDIRTTGPLRTAGLGCTGSLGSIPRQDGGSSMGNRGREVTSLLTHPSGLPPEPQRRIPRSEFGGERRILGGVSRRLHFKATPSRSDLPWVSKGLELSQRHRTALLPRTFKSINLINSKID